MFVCFTTQIASGRITTRFIMLKKMNVCLTLVDSSIAVRTYQIGGINRLGHKFFLYCRNSIIFIAGC